MRTMEVKQIRALRNFFCECQERESTVQEGDRAAGYGYSAAPQHEICQDDDLLCWGITQNILVRRGVCQSSQLVVKLRMLIKSAVALRLGGVRSLNDLGGNNLSDRSCCKETCLSRPCMSLKMQTHLAWFTIALQCTLTIA
jgi:hypothetical protein